MLNELHQFSTNLTDTLRQSVNAIEICSEDRFRIIKKYGKEANFKNSLELIKSFPNLLTWRVDYFVSNTYINLQSISDLVQSFWEATKNNKSNSEKHFQELNIHFMSQIQSVTNTLIDLSNVKFSFVVKSQAITWKAKELCVKACETIQIADCIIISSVNYIMFENVYLWEIEDISSYKSFLTNSSIVIHSYSKWDIPTTDYITPRDYIQIMPEKAQDSPFTNKILPFDLNILKLRTPLDIKSPSILCHTLSARLYIYSNNQFSYSLYLLKKLPKGKYSLFISNPKLKKKLKPHLAKQIKAKKITSIEVGTGIQK